jgi:cytochrome c oxidase subunit 1
MNLTFGPMHILGLEGMSRRIDTYSKGFGFEFWNLVVSIGAFIIALSVLTFLLNVIISYRNYRRAKANGTYVNPGPDPWDARSLEWMISSPPPEHNFDEEIEVKGLDEFWHRKYGFDAHHKVVRIATSEQVAQKGDATNVHLPSPSYWPIVIALGLPIIAYGLLYSLWLCVLGGLLTGGGLFGFALEPPDDPNAVHAHHDEHGPEPVSAEEVSHG